MPCLMEAWYVYGLQMSLPSELEHLIRTTLQDSASELPKGQTFGSKQQTLFACLDLEDAWKALEVKHFLRECSVCSATGPPWVNPSRPLKGHLSVRVQREAWLAEARRSAEQRLAPRSSHRNERLGASAPRRLGPGLVHPEATSLQCRTSTSSLSQANILSLSASQVDATNLLFEQT